MVLFFWWIIDWPVCASLQFLPLTSRFYRYQRGKLFLTYSRALSHNIIVMKLLPCKYTVDITQTELCVFVHPSSGRLWSNPQRVVGVFLLQSGELCRFWPLSKFVFVRSSEILQMKPKPTFHSNREALPNVIIWSQTPRDQITTLYHTHTLSNHYRPSTNLCYICWAPTISEKRLLNHCWSWLFSSIFHPLDLIHFATTLGLPFEQSGSNEWSLGPEKLLQGQYQQQFLRMVTVAYFGTNTCAFYWVSLNWLSQVRKSSCKRQYQVLLQCAVECFLSVLTGIWPRHCLYRARVHTIVMWDWLERLRNLRQRLSFFKCLPWSRDRTRKESLFFSLSNEWFICGGINWQRLLSVTFRPWRTIIGNFPIFFSQEKCDVAKCSDDQF